MEVQAHALDDREWLVTIEVPAGYREEARLDVYLTRFLPNASRSKVQQGIRDNRVTVNGDIARRVSYRVQAGDRIVSRLERPPPMEARPEPIPLDIVHEDPWLIVVDKPAGMVVHPAHGNQTGTLVNALLHHVGAQAISIEEVDDVTEADIGLSVVNASPLAPGDPSIRPGIIHRIDKDTSGLLVVAKDDVTHRKLAAQFERRTIRRRYRAIVWGVPDPMQGTVDAPIGRDPRDRKRMAVVHPDHGKHAVTHYEVTEPFGQFALTEFRLETGRTHQIRVHALSIGHPVLGDERYGGRRIPSKSTGSGRFFLEEIVRTMPRQALHATTLGFRHPHSNQDVDFESPLPPDLQAVLDRLRKSGEQAHLF